MKQLTAWGALVLSAAVSLSGSAPDLDQGRRGLVSLPRSVLLDKIRGGWAGKVIGCTLGGPTEFVFNSTFIPPAQPIGWAPDAVRWCFDHRPGLYDDVYMNLTFVQTLEDAGLDAPAAAFAGRFARALYPLWHANQMARYNILNGIAPPLSGHWLNNPHADDIDFQIEADFAGMMCPGMPNAASGVCDRVGHIMNYGDGYYGGLFVAAMEALAFVENDVGRVVERALAVVPPGAAFARTIRAVIDGHRRHPDDWRETWFEVERDEGRDIGCPEGVFRPFNIDARINAAWVVLGLLYGGGDFGKTIEISCRAGDDSDCNPATAGGVLGVMLGLDRIPEFWKGGLEAIKTRDFPYTNLTLRAASEISFKHALEMVRRNGGVVGADSVGIRFEEPTAAPLEVGFEGIYPLERRGVGVALGGGQSEAAFAFDGVGFVVNGEAVGTAAGGPGEKAAAGALILEMRVDGGQAENLKLPVDELVRKPTIAWKYLLKPGRHVVRFRLANRPVGAGVRIGDVVLYGDNPTGAK